MSEETPTVKSVVQATLPEFTPPQGVRPRQGAVAELGETMAFLVPLGTLVAWVAKAKYPDIPSEAVAAFVVGAGSYGLSRLRDWRYRGGAAQ